MANLRGPHLHTPLTLLSTDRDALSRVDPAMIAPGDDARYLVTRAGSAALREDDEGTLHVSLERSDPRGGGTQPLVLLGVHEGLRVLAVEIPEPSPELDDPGRDLRDLRRVAERLTPRDADLALTAVAMGSWHRSMRHCPMCGALLEPEVGGWVLRCREDGSEHFPRTDAAVIMAVRDSRDRLLLARNANFRGRFHSVLAGFVEPGESLENAVAREVAEEVGLVVEEVEYVGSQPWPFPRSLMVGYRAWVPGAVEMTLQEDEIAEATWFSREELAAALAAEEIELPGNASLGRALIDDWYGGPAEV
ncbi:NAD(+) diphosphatase [Brachybacterium alimentarium]|uniref:NAD(+) diphosphatase n=1 Tax=Brachybacterium alimentarium TaxID=47845 RepID=A0A2A3YHK5_9MICO|nr:NAD(+) diphosphatase [Brachybacterium alimentarium]PCC34981.1 NADH pyrophosphatase [Brachybacterium alimentarium]PCC38767.1 NADH pyrophosphatase [Brachybacterium alimentarium]RCS80371.1 NAD(+) diphosphatase [Brachybacterium alimentarium]RCS90097.1 NAD(+) diphosphatase [Brachybacterium alimentarium]